MIQNQFSSCFLPSNILLSFPPFSWNFSFRKLILSTRRINEPFPFSTPHEGKVKRMKFVFPEVSKINSTKLFLTPNPYPLFFFLSFFLELLQYGLNYYEENKIIPLLRRRVIFLRYFFSLFLSIYPFGRER